MIFVHKDFYKTGRERLIAQLRSAGISDERVLGAIATIPREKFVPDAIKSRAYEDTALPIGNHQTISQPYTVAFMTSALNIKPGDSVLEIGTGSGYQAATLIMLGAKVFTVERHWELYNSAKKTLDELGLSAQSRFGDGTIGWSEFAPYDAIIVTAGAPELPQSLLLQLAIGGRMIIPVGDERSQTLKYVVRKDDREFDAFDMQEFRFVPLIGKEGWTVG
ncbi:MAG: protein-L-isoaspartate(D-aspartate) O-methyltransferase [Bacteroidetes bacterium]|nr:protein-L-isoaspartate(D-aspartate) O-methyltransferase [Bacteroidota bacterium]